MKTFDDIFYLLYMEYYNNRNGFYNKHYNEIQNIFYEYSNCGKFWFKYTIAKNGDHCIAVTCIYKNQLIHNKIGYKTKDIALMSMIDAIRKNDFDKFI